MGHSLELYAKAALVSPDGAPPHGHDVPALISQFDESLTLTTDEVSAGETLFRPDAANIDLGLWEKHGEAMELYQAMYFLKDLKYYIAKDGNIIFPVRKSLKPINIRYLEMVARLRLSLEHRDSRVDEELLGLVAQLGFKENPLNAVVEKG